MKMFFLITLGASAVGLLGSLLFGTHHGAVCFLAAGFLSLAGYWIAYKLELI